MSAVDDFAEVICSATQTYRSKVGKSANGTPCADQNGRQEKINKPVNRCKGNGLVSSGVSFLELHGVDLGHDSRQFSDVGACQLHAADIGSSLDDFQQQVTVYIYAGRYRWKIVYDSDAISC